MLRHLALIAFCSLLTVVGLVGGWYAARQAAPPAADAEDPAAGSHGGDSHALDARTLANLGVRVGKVERKTFVRHRPVQAVIEDRPRNLQPVVAPLGGLVTAVNVEEGGAVDAGAAVVVLARDPIPRPKPDLTAAVLTPISEEVHDGIASLRSALGRLGIVDRNLARIRKAREGRPDGSIPILRKEEIEFENERDGVRVAIEGARHELERHGLTEKQIDAVEKGEHAPSTPHLWEQTLRRHGIWSKAADDIRAALSRDVRFLPWCVAAIGELFAAGLASAELAKALGEDADLAGHFAEVASLMLEGTPLTTVRLLSKAGALEPVTVLRAPPGTDRWDVQDVAVRPHQRVEVGQVLVRLHDARTMWLRLEPVGAEIGHVVRALGAGTPLEAVPLVPHSGPPLDGVRLVRMATFASPSESGGRAYAAVPNARLCPAGEAVACSWHLRVGLRYVVKLPVEALKGRFVLPAGAVTSRGPDRVVYVVDGESFRAQPVRVEYEDDEVTVVADDGGIYADDEMALSGAFALGLALQAGEKAGMDHGHSH